MDTKAIESQVNGQNTAQGFDQFGSDSIGWNAKLEDVPEDQSHSLYRLLPEGDYDFTVEDVNYGRTKTGNNMVTVKLIIKVPGENDVHVDDRLIFTVKAQWKLVSFFKSIGLFEEAQTSGMNWDHVPDRSGRLTLKHRVYNEKTYNQVAKYLFTTTPAVTKPNQQPATVEW